tara:strand:- start:101 stop:340 length:240 start_codon:yes stop_codon:yes gene_type:complete
MLIYTKDRLNLIGIIMGVTYTLNFNWQNGDNAMSMTFAYSLPFLLFSAILGFGISKLRKDKNFGIYFALISLLLSAIKI